MKFIDYAATLETIKSLAQQKRAGTPRQLAEKLDVSERTIQRMVQQLRRNGYPIIYNRFRFTYEVQEYIGKC